MSKGNKNDLPSGWPKHWPRKSKFDIFIMKGPRGVFGFTWDIATDGVGEITEMMEEGLLCQACGVYLNIDGEYGDDDEFQGTGTWTTCKNCKE